MIMADILNNNIYQMISKTVYFIIHQITEKKDYIIEPLMGHSYPAKWYSKMNELFNKYY